MRVKIYHWDEARISKSMAIGKLKQYDLNRAYASIGMADHWLAFNNKHMAYRSFNLTLDQIKGLLNTYQSKLKAGAAPKIVSIIG